MPSLIRTVALNALLASALVPQVLAQPTGFEVRGTSSLAVGNADAESPYEVSYQETENETAAKVARIADPDLEKREEDVFEADDDDEQESQSSTLEKRTKKDGGKIKESYSCPKTNRYEEKVFTGNDITKAYKTATRHSAHNKQIGANHYPHKFGNNENLKFDCNNKYLEEFPIDLSGDAYSDSSDIRGIPDRIVYEKRKNGFKFCGVMRHGNGRDFVSCSPRGK